MSGSWIARLAEGKKSGDPGLKLSGLEFTLRQNLCRHRNSIAVTPCERPTPAMATKKRRAAGSMRVEVMKVAQQPAMAYDRISLSTPARSGKSGLLLKSLYAYSRPTALALLSVLTLFRDGQLACDLASAQSVCGCMSAGTRPQLASARTNSGAAESSSSTKGTSSQQSNELRRAALSALK